MLWMYQRVFFGEGARGEGRGTGGNTIETPHASLAPAATPGRASAHQLQDLSLREILTLAPLVIMIFWIGLQPQFFLDRIGPTTENLMTPAIRAAEERGEKGEGRGERGGGETVGGTKYEVPSTNRPSMPPVHTPSLLLCTLYSPSLAPRPSPLAP
jgi:hypothetical protein